jgi:hypothetical protein
MVIGSHSSGSLWHGHGWLLVAPHCGARRPQRGGATLTRVRVVVVPRAWLATPNTSNDSSTPAESFDTKFFTVCPK